MPIKRLVIPALLFLTTLAAFWPALRSDAQFVNFDDSIYITQNPHVTGGLTGDNIAWAFTTSYAQNWHPLTWLSLMLDAQVYGTRPWGYHLTNVLLHSANAILLYLLLLAMTRSAWRSAAVAALFALHPLRAESVAWATERKDVLSAFFGLLSMLAYVHYTRAPARRWRYFPVAAAYALSLMAKPMLVTLPVLLLLLDFWPLRRIVVHAPGATGSLPASALDEQTPTPQPDRKARALADKLPVAPPPPPPFPQQSRTALLLEKLPLLALAAASAIVTFLVAQQSPAMRTLTEISPGARLANVLIAFVRYLGKTFWPTDLAMFYPMPASWPPGLVAGSAVVLVGITLVALWRRNDWNWLLVGWGWFVVALFPVIGIVHVGHQAMADRYTYLPSIGIAIALIWSIPERWVQTSAGRAALGAVGCVVGVILIALTRVQAGYWHDSITLASHTLSVTPDNWLAEKNLGTALGDTGDIDGAIKHLRRALDIKPDLYPVYYDLGAVYVAGGQLTQAEASFRQAIAAHDDIAQFHVNLANVLALEGRDQDAEQEYLRAISVAAKQPQINGLVEVDNRLCLGEAHNNLGVLLGRRGDHAGELREYEAAAASQPTYLMGRLNLGTALLTSGSVDRAIQEFKAVISLKPDEQTSRVAEQRLNQARALKALGG